MVWRTTLDGNLVPKGSFASMMSFAHPSYNRLDLFKEFPTVIQLVAQYLVKVSVDTTWHMSAHYLSFMHFSSHVHHQSAVT